MLQTLHKTWAELFLRSPTLIQPLSSGSLWQSGGTCQGFLSRSHELVHRSQTCCVPSCPTTVPLLSAASVSQSLLQELARILLMRPLTRDSSGRSQGRKTGQLCSLYMLSYSGRLPDNSGPNEHFGKGKISHSPSALSLPHLTLGRCLREEVCRSVKVSYSFQPMWQYRWSPTGRDVIKKS
jgi:hypothetical protein